MRAQANLAALAVGLVALTSVTVLGVVLADDALVAADREPLERRAAVVGAARLVAADSPLTVRENVVDREALSELTVDAFQRLVPPLAGREVRVRVGERVVLARGDPTGGTTVTRVVLLASREAQTRRLPLSAGTVLTVPRRAAEVTIDFTAARGVETVRANGRVVLHDSTGLEGTTTVAISRFETTTLALEGTGPLSGTITVTYRPESTTKALLEVTVDD